MAEFQELNEKRQTEERGKLLESIQVATNNLAKAKGYTYVLDANSVVFAVDGKDITEEVLKSIPATEKAAPAKTEEKKIIGSHNAKILFFTGISSKSRRYPSR